MRGQGRVYRPKVNGCTVQVWWLDYSHRGQRHRESSGTTSKTEALKLLRARAAARDVGKLIGSPDKVTLAQMRALVEQSYQRKGNRSLDRLKQAFAHIEEHFGAAARAPDLSTTAIGDYESARLNAGAARATVGYEKASLRQAFRIAIKAGLLATMPVIETPKVNNARSGFFTAGDLAALMLELPPVLQPLIRFLYLVGWRRDEGRLLQWEAVDWEANTVRLGSHTKSGEPRVFPFGLAPELKELLEAQWQIRDGLYVFHDNGEPIGKGKLRSGWRRATKRAGLEGRKVHDLRRSAARDMRRAGLAESDIMELCGWETREMFKRYCIRDEAALAQAVAKRFAPSNGKGQAKSEVPTPTPEGVS